MYLSPFFTPGENMLAYAHPMWWYYTGWVLIVGIAIYGIRYAWRNRGGGNW